MMRPTLVCLLGLLHSVGALDVFLGADPALPERTAAEELATYIERMTGTALPVRGPGEPPATNAIFVERVILVRHGD